MNLTLIKYIFDKRINRYFDRRKGSVIYILGVWRPVNHCRITRGGNRAFTYRVVATKIYPFNKVDMDQALSPVIAGKPALNLMTCTGQVIKGTSEFDERLVVFTSLAAS